MTSPIVTGLAKLMSVIEPAFKKAAAERIAKATPSPVQVKVSDPVVDPFLDSYKFDQILGLKLSGYSILAKARAAKFNVLGITTSLLKLGFPSD